MTETEKEKDHKTQGEEGEKPDLKQAPAYEPPRLKRFEKLEKLILSGE